MAARSSLLVLVLTFGLLFSLLYFSGTYSPEISGEDLTVRTDKPSYNANDLLVISGTVPNSMQEDPGLPVIIQMYNPDGNIMRIDQVSLEPDASFNYEVRLGGPLGSVQGEYRVVANYADHQVETSFTLE